MSTFMANKGNIVRKWYVLDAAGKPMGKTAALAADLLRGKRKRVKISQAVHAAHARERLLRSLKLYQ